MIKFGYITEVNMDVGTVRVRFTEDDIVSNPLPVSCAATKEDKYSFPFAINEHVCCLMDDQCEFGVVIGAIYSTEDKPPAGANKNKIIINIGNATVKLDIDRSSGNIKIETPGNITVVSSMMKLDAPEVLVTGNINIDGAVTAVGEIKSGVIELTKHKHISSSPGNPTSAPTP
ncbi:MAG: hypothetical protein H3C36_02165 [Chitinophagaceae bacterium]|nr:hypothetical protein [Chitinophagaceae bacterium]